MPLRQCVFFLLSLVILAFRHSQQLRVKRLMERSKRQGGFSGGERYSQREDKSQNSDCRTAARSTDDGQTVATASRKEDSTAFPARSCILGANNSPVSVAATPDGPPFSPYEVAESVLSGGLGRLEETYGYASHLVQLAQLLLEQNEATEEGGYPEDWQDVVDAELAFYRAVLQVDNSSERTVASDFPTLGGLVSLSRIRGPHSPIPVPKKCRSALEPKARRGRRKGGSNTVTDIRGCRLEKK
ncbi:hypothetical protein cyc_00503 [Cyclospora cayetanensis]|uniref:Uncharacterized protein n=1 Tax=Cyclospora cayetanensis TaxID=88456 RepID=A0A1D3CZW3_9EIME|nr:hypothetical protein cyc_00503 [Cyclospora cayetanensis]